MLVIVGVGGPLLLWGLYQLVFRFLLDWNTSKYEGIGFGLNIGWLCFVLLTMWIWCSLVRLAARWMIKLLKIETGMTWQMWAITIISSFFFAAFAAFAVDCNNTSGPVMSATGTIAEKSIYRKPSIGGSRIIYHVAIEWKWNDTDISDLCAVDSADYKLLSVGDRLNIKYQKGLFWGSYCYLEIVTESGLIIRNGEKNGFTANRGVRD